MARSTPVGESRVPTLSGAHPLTPEEAVEATLSPPKWRLLVQLFGFDSPFDFLALQTVTRVVLFFFSSVTAYSVPVKS